MDVGDVDAKATKWELEINDTVDADAVKAKLLVDLPESRQAYEITLVSLCISLFQLRIVANFIAGLYKTFVDFFFTYLEINPIGIEAFPSFYMNSLCHSL